MNRRLAKASFGPEWSRPAAWWLIPFGQQDNPRVLQRADATARRKRRKYAAVIARYDEAVLRARMEGR